MFTEKREGSFEYTSKTIVRRGIGNGSLTNSTQAGGNAEGSSVLSEGSVVAAIELLEETARIMITNNIEVTTNRGF